MKKRFLLIIIFLFFSNVYGVPVYNVQDTFYVIDSKVGIGTTEPEETLHIKTSPNAEIIVEAGLTGGSVLNFGDGTDKNIGRIYYNHADDYMDFKTNDIIQMKLDANGYLGIGTENPTCELDVVGTINVSERLLVGNGTARVGVGTTEPEETLHIKRDGNAEIILESNLEGGSVLNFGDGTDKNVGRIYYDHANDDMAFSTNDLIRLTIDASGNVGVGTTDPETSLHIKKTGNAILTLETSATGGSVLNFSDGINNNIGRIFYDHINERMDFNTNDLIRLTIDTNGNVGIGLTNPSSELDVSGDVNISEDLIVGGGIDAGNNGIKIIFDQIDIGTWDMTSGPKTVNWALPINHAGQILMVDVIVRGDNQPNSDLVYPFLKYSSSGFPEVLQAGLGALTSQNIVLRITPSIKNGFFDGSNWDGTAFNRGWINVWYNPN